MTGRFGRIGVVVGIALLLVPQITGAQGPRSEKELLTSMTQSPDTISNYLDLVKLYADQGRLADAEAILSRAVTVVHRQRQDLTPPSTSGAILRVGGDIPVPTKIRDVKPAYPADALAARVGGVVVLEILVAPDGSVSNANVLRSVALLDNAAVEAVLQWRFTPTLLNGAPVSVLMTVTVNFTPQ